MPLAQRHIENIGSAQVKSAILLAGLNTLGLTIIEEKKISRNHTENLLKAINHLYFRTKIEQLYLFVMEKFIILKS